MLTARELGRYRAHLSLPEIGLRGQMKLKKARVLCVGVGGLGSPVSLYLAAAGVGCIGLLDEDIVDESNLQRQIAHYTSDVGCKKVESAARKIRDLNHLIEVVCHDAMLPTSNALDIIRGYDVIVDASDNYATRYMVNDACVLLQKVNVHGSIFRFSGQATVFDARVGPCYRCLFPAPDEETVPVSCSDAGVLGVLPGLLGIIQANEVLKTILGIGETLIGRLLAVDLLGGNFERFEIGKRVNCPACGKDSSIRTVENVTTSSGLVCAALAAKGRELSPKDAHKRSEATPEDVIFIDVREHQECFLERINGTLNLSPRELWARISEIDRAKTYVLYCDNGSSSKAGVELMLLKGFKHVYSLKGGMEAWRAEFGSDALRQGQR
jgi:molybdopterin/thiamine biosynthesis adenylyltransferase/rhodanese-related sulfurtransferase